MTIGYYIAQNSFRRYLWKLAGVFLSNWGEKETIMTSQDKNRWGLPRLWSPFSPHSPLSVQNSCSRPPTWNAAAAVTSVMSYSVRPTRRQPTRLCHPWDSPGKNTGVGCHVLLQCMKLKSESEVTQLYLTLRNPMDHSLPGSFVHGIFQARIPEWVAIAFSTTWYEE